MRIEIRQIMSMKLHGASCHLLILDSKTYILLGCGINANFDFSHYRAQQQDLSRVSIILLTHPSLEHLGALPFLLEQFNIRPKVYASQTVIILGPLNIHQAMLNQRSQKYTSQVLKRIYLIFQNIIAVKPMQRKRYDLQSPEHQATPIPKKLDSDPHHHSIHLMCYQAGSEIGCVCWRISYCMFSCVYLVGYDNYKQYHLDGMDLDSVISRKTDILITDTYAERERLGVVRKEGFKEEVAAVLRAWVGRGEGEKGRRLVMSCTPNQRLVELMNVLTQLSAEKVFQGKVDLVHYSYSYFQLIKSQLDYRFTDENADQDGEEVKINQNQTPPSSIFDKDFNSHKKLHNKICITTAAAVRSEGLLWQELGKLGPDSLLVHIGRDPARPNQSPNPFQSIPKIFAPPIPTQQPVVPQLPAPSIQIQQQKPSQMPTVKTQATEFQSSLIHQKSMMSGQYIHCFNFPKFISRAPQHKEWDAYGEYDEYDRQHYDMPLEEELPAVKPPELRRKKTNIDNLNVELKLPAVSGVQKLPVSEQEINSATYLTTFESSLQIINLINPEKLVFINGQATDYQAYQRAIAEMRSRAVQDRARKFQVFGFERWKKYVVFQNNSETIQQAMNLYNEQSLLVQDMTARNFLKVNGSIVLKPNNEIEIVLSESGEKELMEFNMAEFYKAVNSKGAGYCRFTDNGVLEINDVKLYRRRNEITIEGLYSIEYFQLREQLYHYVARREVEF